MPTSVRSKIHKLTSRMRSERGIALPAALMMLLVISSLSAVAATAATSGANQSVEDKSTKRALAASDGGLETAVYRSNKVPHAPDKCVITDSNGVLAVTDPASDGWCPVQSENLGDGASYTYRVSAGRNVTQNGQYLVERTIVSTGCVLPGASPAQCMASAAGVKRRAKTVVAALSESVFGPGGVLSKETLTVENNAYVAASVASNDDVILRNNAEICGNVTYGPSSGDDFSQQNNGVFNCPGTSATKAQEEFLLNPVDGSGARTNNNNGNFFVTDTKTGSASWDANNRILTITNGSTVTLTGDTYSFCYLHLELDARLIIAPRAAGRPPLRLFIDKPENCAGAGSDKGSVRVENNAAIVNQTNDPAMLQLYVEGSSTIATSVTFRNNSGTEDTKLVVYAPNSTFTVENNGNLRGAVAAKRIIVENNGSLTWDSRALAVTMSTSSVYQQRSWTECPSKASGNPPDAGC